MIDREKVLQALAHHGRGECITQDVVCPYWGVNVHDDADACFRQLCKDALELLKEREAVKPIWEQDSMVCGVCGHDVIWQKPLGDGFWGDEELNYCPFCGRKVKWDADD